MHHKSSACKCVCIGFCHGREAFRAGCVQVTPNLSSKFRKRENRITTCNYRFKSEWGYERNLT